MNNAARREFGIYESRTMIPREPAAKSQQMPDFKGICIDNGAEATVAGLSQYLACCKTAQAPTKKPEKADFVVLPKMLKKLLRPQGY